MSEETRELTENEVVLFQMLKDYSIGKDYPMNLVEVASVLAGVRQGCIISGIPIWDIRR